MNTVRQVIKHRSACRMGTPESGRAGVPILQGARASTHPRRSVAVLLLIALGLFAVCPSPPALAQTSDGSLPKYKELPLPSAEDLLRNKPFDWIVLKTEDVLVVEPVSPRHDPVMRLNLKQKQAETTYARVLKYKPARMAEVDQQLARNRDLNVDVLRAEVDGPQSARPGAHG